MAARVPLSTLLSRVLIAYTIEFDNEFEHQSPHQTTWGPAAHSRRGPWLVSMAMWSNFMQYVSAPGAPLHELDDLVRMTNLGGMERWGYVVVEPDPAEARPKPPRRDWLVRPTPAGERAQEVWRPLAGMIEKRWQSRFGEEALTTLRASSQALVGQFGLELPQYLPVVNFAGGMRAALPHLASRRPVTSGAPDLSVLLSQVLLAYTLEVERESDLSLAISANALRVLDVAGVPVRDLPRLAGVSKEAISASVGFMERSGYLVVEPDPGAGRAKVARLTAKGGNAAAAYRRLVGLVEDRWEARFGADRVRALRESLQGLVDAPEGERSRLAEGLVPYPDGWRASKRYVAQTTAVADDPVAALPHYPMVLHRGGWPDGS